ncbi:MAG: HEAT repeat domain-containing protein, partial [Lentisphaeraceae bacterium]|nr:HEAT repeat domain-containing protein [Lentisphaeraceae bacterium]
ILKNDKYLKNKSVVDAAKKLKTGFKNVASLQLRNNLAHEDMRVRMYSQFELVKRGDEGGQFLAQALAEKENVLARLHAVWGIGQLSRQQNSYNRLLLPFLNDADWRVRANIAKVIGESKDAEYLTTLINFLNDPNQRVKFFAATALGKLGSSKKIVKALINEAQKNKDIYLRHSIVAGLTYCANAEEIRAYKKHSSAAVRTVVLLALTRLKDHSIVEFLQDSDNRIVRETVRAIDRMNIDEVTMKAAAFLKNIASGKASLQEMEIERILQWNFREGSSRSVENVLAVSLNKELSSRIRLIAINDLARWNKIPPMDPVNGQVRSINPQRGEVKGATAQLVKALQDDKSDKEINSLVMGLAIEYGLAKNMNILSLKILDHNEALATRLDLLRKLTQANDPSVKELLRFLLNDKQKAMRREALITLHKIDLPWYSKHMSALLSKQTDLQVAYSVLSTVKDEKHSKYLLKSFKALLRNSHEADSVLELLEAAATLENPAVKKKLAAYKKLKGDDELFEFRAAMFGGDRIRGRQLVYQQGLGQCIICHKIEDKGGIVAPDLSNIADHQRSTREYLLESLIKPSAYVVPGFGNITLNLKGGSSIVASLIFKDKKKIVIKLISGENVTYPMSQVNSSTDPISSMPPMAGILNKYDLRDIIAYLTSLKTAEH